MKNKISIEYAEAIFAIAMEENKTAEYYEELRLVDGLIKESPEYLELLMSPSIEAEEKLSLIDSAFLGKLMDNTINLIKLLCERNRIELFHECFMDYERLYNASRQTAFVTVISAVELTDTERERIKASLEAKYKLSVELRCEIDKSIMGGIIIKTDDAIMDGSLFRKLQDVKEVINK
jgi:F-type H+-transporting ATPase subunit delta